MANERITEQIFKEILNKNGYKNKKNVLVSEQQVPTNSKYYDVFNRASKRQNCNKGYPDFFIELKEYDINIVVECKYHLKKHASINLENPSDYAVDGAVWYSKFSKEKTERRIAIGVSGHDSSTLNIDIYIYKNDKLIKILPNNKAFPSPLDFYLIYENLNKNKKIEDFRKIAADIHNKLYNIGSSTAENPLIVSSILIVLNNEDFRNSYKNITDSDNLAKQIIQYVEKELKKHKLSEKNINALITRIKFLESHRITEKSNKTTLRKFIDILNENVYKYMKNEIKEIYIDEVGYFYNEFLKHTGSGDDKGLGIVLTPYHICDLFVELARVNKRSIVIDITAGTGGFLVASLSKMMSLSPTLKEKEKIKKNNLIGFESKSDIFALLLSNMLIRNDGKSNAQNRSCFDLTSEKINKEWKPNVGMINPPYAQEKKEWEFIAHMLDSLEPNSKGIAIIPTSACWNEENKNFRKKILQSHTLKGSFAMKHDLFGTTGVNTNILVFEAHKPHIFKNSIYFAQWHDDGLERKKSQLLWTDKNGLWKQTKEKWVSQFEDKKENRYALNEKINDNVSMKPEDYIKNDFSDFNFDLIRKKITSYTNLLMKHNRLILNDNFKLKKENIQSFKKMKLSHFFEFSKGKSIDKKLRVQGEIPYVGASMNNNGISEYIKPIEKAKLIQGNVISMGSQGQTGAGTTFYQPFSFICSGTSISLIPKFKMTSKIGIYISALLETNKFLFNFGNKVSIETLEDMKVPLPFKDGKIDVKKIENIVDSIEQAKYICDISFD